MYSYAIVSKVCYSGFLKSSGFRGVLPIVGAHSPTQTYTHPTAQLTTVFIYITTWTVLMMFKVY